MYFAMNIDKADYPALKDVHTVIGDFYAAVRHHVAKNPQLQAAIDNVENKTQSDQLIQARVSDMKNLLAERIMTEDFSRMDTQQQIEAQEEIEMQCAVVEAQQFDHFIGIMERFTHAGMMAERMLPAKAKDYPVALATTMEKYGMKRTANVIYQHLALQHG